MESNRAEAETGRAPRAVEDAADALFDAVAAVVGSRLVERRIDTDGGLRATIVDLNQDDEAAVSAMAEQLGVARWTRTERADPASFALWDRLRLQLISVFDAYPKILQGGPGTEPGFRRGPIEINFAPRPEAEQVAARLHAEFGDYVQIRIGALPFPLTDSSTSPPRRGDDERPDTVSPHELTIELDGPLAVPRGHTVTHAILVTNVSDHEIGVRTNRYVTAEVVNSTDGRVVGGYSGGHRMPLQVFRVGPSQTTRIPLLVGTASYEPGLGHALPVGAWQLLAPLDLDDGRHLVSAGLPFTITD